jgi:hypothetical protein
MKKSLNTKTNGIKELDKDSLTNIQGGLHVLTKLFLKAIGYMGGEVAWGVKTEGTALRYVAFK